MTRLENRCVQTVAGQEGSRPPAPVTINASKGCIRSRRMLQRPGAALVPRACNTEAMQLHIDEIATKVAPACTPFLSSISQMAWRQRVPRHATTRSCRCHHARLGSTTKKTSGSSCGKTDCQTHFKRLR
jgi:hypothetical protein